MKKLPLMIVAAALAATPAAAADLKLSDAWVRLPAVQGRPAAAYFMITGGATPQTVTGISSPSAARAELHESRQVGGLMKMAPLPRLAVAKGQMVMFQPGGKHVMLFGLDPKVKAGGTVRLDLKLADGSTASVDAKAVSAADGAPAGMSHDHKH
jgi:copper(I)-binding protein